MRQPAAITAEELEQVRILAYWRDYVDSPRGSVEEIIKVYLELRAARVDCERFLKAKDGDPFVAKGKIRLAEIFLKDPTTSFWSNVNGVNCTYDRNTKDCFIRSSSGYLYIDMADQMGRAKFYVCDRTRKVL